MNNLQTHINNYLEHCRHQKRLDSKTLKAYRIDLQQFYAIFSCRNVSDITPDLLENYIGSLHQKYKPKTVKRKIASVKALFHYLEYKEIIARNPFNKVQIKFREPVILPKPFHCTRSKFSYLRSMSSAPSPKRIIREKTLCGMPLS